MAIAIKDNRKKELFSCTQCGECCHIREPKHISAEEERAYKNYMFKNYGIVYLAPLDSITISIWPEEKELLERKAKKDNVKINIRPKRAIYNSKAGELMIIDYFIDHDVCPFFDEEKKLCKAYDERPLICRSYPLTSTTSYGKCKHKELDFKMYGEEMDHARELERRINKQKVIIAQMLESGDIRVPKTITEHEMLSFLEKARYTELRILDK